MVDGINNYRAIDNMTNGSNGGRNFSLKNGTPKQSIFLEKKTNYVENDTIDGGILPEVEVYGKRPDKPDVAKLDEPVNGGTSPENCDNGQNPDNDVVTLDGGMLKEVVVYGKRPDKPDVAKLDEPVNGGTLPEVVITAPKPEVAVAAKPKRGFLAWLGRTLGLSKA